MLKEANRKKKVASNNIAAVEANAFSSKEDVTKARELCAEAGKEMEMVLQLMKFKLHHCAGDIVF